MYINTVMIYGNLTRDPELKALPSGQSVTTFGVATNRTYKDKDGKQQEETEFHNVVVWGKSAENCAKYLTKGAGVFVEGRLATRSWDKDGVKQYRTEIVAEKVQFGPKRDGVAKTDSSESALPEYLTDEVKPEDIPF